MKFIHISGLNETQIMFHVKHLLKQQRNNGCLSEINRLNGFMTLKTVSYNRYDKLEFYINENYNRTEVTFK